MLRLHCNITIGNLFFDYVTNCQVNTSWQTLTDTAMVELPSKITNKDNTFIKDIIKVGDPVEIKLGYYPDLVTRFTGYVSKLVPESPLKVMCEDESFLLKRETINNYSVKKVTLKKLLEDNYSGELQVVDAVLGNFRIDRVSLVKVLQELKNKYKIWSWFRNRVLYSGLAYLPDAGVNHNLGFQTNIIDGSGLQTTDETELNTIAHGISTQKDGTKIELYTYYENENIVTKEGNPSGDLNTLKLPNKTKAQLQELLERWLPNLHYTGFKGSVTTFGHTPINHGDRVTITDLKFPEKNGTYAVKSVTVNFGQGGYRQVAELDRAL